jgi:hypothetical protein
MDLRSFSCHETASAPVAAVKTHCSTPPPEGSDGEAHVDVAWVAGVETLAASSLSDVGFSEHDDPVEGDQDKEGHDRLAAPPSAREDSGRRVRGRGFASL